MEAFFAFFTASAFTPICLIQIRLFPTQVRYTALSLAWTLNISLFSTTTPILANYLWKTTHAILIPPLLASIVALIAFIAVVMMNQTSAYYSIDESQSKLFAQNKP